MKNMTKNSCIILGGVLLLVGCASDVKRSQVSSPSLSGISKHVSTAEGKIKTVIQYVPVQQATTLESSLLDLQAAQKELSERQVQVDVLTASLNTATDRLNYIEPKYSEAVGLLWKWRMISVGALFVGILAGGVLMAIFRVWLKAQIPILG